MLKTAARVAKITSTTKAKTTEKIGEILNLQPLSLHAPNRPSSELYCDAQNPLYHHSYGVAPGKFVSRLLLAAAWIPLTSAAFYVRLTFSSRYTHLTLKANRDLCQIHIQGHDWLWIESSHPIPSGICLACLSNLILSWFLLLQGITHWWHQRR